MFILLILVDIESVGIMSAPGHCLLISSGHSFTIQSPNEHIWSSLATKILTKQNSKLSSRNSPNVLMYKDTQDTCTPSFYSCGMTVKINWCMGERFTVCVSEVYLVVIIIQLSYASMMCKCANIYIHIVPPQILLKPWPSACPGAKE